MTDKREVNDKKFLLCPKCHKGYMESSEDGNIFDTFPKTIFKCNLCGHIEYYCCCPN